MPDGVGARTGPVTRELSGPYRMHFVVFFAVLVVVVGGLPLALDGSGAGTAVWVFLTAGTVLLWRRARTRVLIDEHGVALANTFQTHRFEWSQVEKLRADVNLVFTVRIPPYVDELRSSGVGSIGGAPAAVEQDYLESTYEQLREYRAGTRPLHEVGRPSRHSRDDTARWESWRLDAIVFAAVAITGPALAAVRHGSWAF
ncbi:PH domain-containing protein [Jannaschia sp. R86511]|uniref:PH domain-containing protein n=1 Tax=Jannaschia sp. R86511 TaxID=3093853 RepID=UPI0036D430BE